jgi:hypothetical protein
MISSAQHFIPLPDSAACSITIARPKNAACKRTCWEPRPLADMKQGKQLGRTHYIDHCLILHELKHSIAGNDYEGCIPTDPPRGHLRLCCDSYALGRCAAPAADSAYSTRCSSCVTLLGQIPGCSCHVCIRAEPRKMLKAGGCQGAPASPRERVKAVPGYMASGAHSRGGSPSSSSSVVQHCTVGSCIPYNSSALPVYCGVLQSVLNVV